MLVYYWFCFTDNTFVSKYRTLYIETALSTLSHQWMATELLPDSVVSNVVLSMQQAYEDNIKIESEHKVPNIESTEIKAINAAFNGDIAIKNKETFKLNYKFIDYNTLPNDLEYNNLDIQDIADLGIKTIYGDNVWAINTIEGIVIIEVSGDNYKGKLCIVKDASRFGVVKTRYLGYGQTVKDMTNDNGGILGINAGGFDDPEGLGTGGEPSGLVISNGNIVNELGEYDYYSTAWMDTSNNFNVGTHVNFETVRDAVQFFPILVANGKKVVSGSYGLGIQPRTAIGQAVSGDILILAIDGRQLGYSLGTDVSECADILIKYGAWNTMNMDGGSSTELVYKGLTINKPSSVGENGRSIATAWIVYPLKQSY